MFLFADLLVKIQSYMRPGEIKQVARAYLCAADAHEDQARSSGEPYITHPLAVSCILADMHMEPETIMAALLHDVVEDTEMTHEGLADLFSEKVAELVDGVTKLAKIKFQSKAEAQAENLRKMMLAMVKDIRIILIKLSDRLHNMQTLGALRADKRRRIALETLEIYAPIANRLGMNDFKLQFENLGFEALYPMRYRVLKECVSHARGHRKRLLEKLKHKIVEQVKQVNISEESVSGREKHMYSIYKKMLYKGLPFSEIMDVYGFRVVAKDRAECYSILGAVHEAYKPVPGRFKDYIAIPKANGYQSLHTTLFGPYGVPIEVQIRTRDMDRMAHSGIAAHWLYKTAQHQSKAVARHAEKWLASVGDMHKESSSTDFVEHVKFDLFPDEVYVFTPKGEVMALPKNATVIDFAYAVHSEIGNQCLSAKINRRLVPLSQELENGQTVEIITANQANPNPGWLKFVTTGKARSAIKHFLNNQKKQETLVLGKRLLEYSLRSLGIKLGQVSQNIFKALSQDMGYDNEDAICAAIGKGEKISAVVAHKISALMANEVDTKQETPTDSVGNSVVPITGISGMGLHFAACCTPIPGDKVKGVLALESGIEVHTWSCGRLAEAVSTHAPESIVTLTWAKDLQDVFPVGIRVETENKKGIIARVAKEIAAQGVNITRFNLEESDKAYGIFSIMVEVENRANLAQLMRKLRSKSFIMKVERIKQ